MIQQQRSGLDVCSVPEQLIRNYGVASLLRGVVPTMGREGIYTMTMLSLCPIAQQWLQIEVELEAEAALAYGAIVLSVVATTITQPLDTIKTCMQVM